MTKLLKNSVLVLVASAAVAVAAPASALPAFSGSATPSELAGVSQGWNHGRHHEDDEYYGDRRGYQGPIWQGRDGRYRCRRSDGTTGLLIGGVVGGVIGHEIVGRRGDKTAGTLIGAVGGALIGRSIDRSGTRCR